MSNPLPAGSRSRLGTLLPRLRARDGRHVVPVACLSIWDPIFLGIDEDGCIVVIELVGRNILIAGEPGGGKSGLLNNIVAHAALSPDVRLCLLDGKLVELILWKDIADVFVGKDPEHAIQVLTLLQAELDRRLDWLAERQRRNIARTDPCPVILVAVDEIAYFSATAGDKKTQEAFAVLLRDLVARGRAAGIIVVAATQRPSADIIPTSLRDIFGYRCAFRCTTDVSSDIVLGFGWAKEGYSAKKIAPEDRGVGLLLAEGGIPRRFKAAYLSDDEIIAVARRALWIRGGGAAA
jgi:S-DNA-T family DNA segregation ATPase FtsK/SpoIIIE